MIGNHISNILCNYSRRGHAISVILPIVASCLAVFGLLFHQIDRCGRSTDTYKNSLSTSGKRIVGSSIPTVSPLYHDATQENHTEGSKNHLVTGSNENASLKNQIVPSGNDIASQINHFATGENDIARPQSHNVTGQSHKALLHRDSLYLHSRFSPNTLNFFYNQNVVL